MLVGEPVLEVGLTSASTSPESMSFQCPHSLAVAAPPYILIPHSTFPTELQNHSCISYTTGKTIWSTPPLLQILQLRLRVVTYTSSQVRS